MYHASSIRLWRVLLLRSDIRLSPSDICFASFKANRISLWGEAEQYHCPKGHITLCAAKNITHIKQKRESFTEFHFRITLSFCFYRKFRICNTNTVGLCPYRYSNSPIRTTPILFLLFYSDVVRCELNATFIICWRTRLRLCVGSYRQR